MCGTGFEEVHGAASNTGGSCKVCGVEGSSSRVHAPAAEESTASSVALAVPGEIDEPAVLRTVVVAGLDRRHDERTVTELFHGVGEVTHVRRARHKRTGKTLGVAYAEFTNTEAVKVAEDLSGSLFGGAVRHIRA